MNNTPNINLSTYTSDPNDKFNLLVTFNNNMTKIDTAVGAQNDAIDVIEETAGTAVTTANTASATATEALTTAEGKTSVNDNVASATTTYSSNKINELISGGAVIDDTTTSTTKTWSSSKINTEITTLTQKNTSNIQNPNTNEYSDWYCNYANRGNIVELSGSFRLNQAPAGPITTLLTLPEDMKPYIPGDQIVVNGYINKTGSMTFLKNDIMFRAYHSGSIDMIFTDDFDYSQIDSSYLFHYSFTLIKN